MRNVWYLTQRELMASFFSPVAYVVGVVFLALTGLYFMSDTLVPGNEASLRTLFEGVPHSWNVGMAGVLVVLVPLLTMRTIAEEFSTGTIETLMTAPVTDAEVVLGKFLGVLTFYCGLLVATLFYLILLALYGEPSAGAIAFAYLGMVLLGAMYIAVGLFASACTRHQLLAALLAVAILVLLTFVVDILAEHLPGTWRAVLGYINIFRHFSDFSKGIFDTRGVVFFVSGTAFFLFLATKVLESRRWR